MDTEEPREATPLDALLELAAGPVADERGRVAESYYTHTLLALIDEAVEDADRRAHAAVKRRDLLRQAADKIREADEASAPTIEVHPGFKSLAFTYNRDAHPDVKPAWRFLHEAGREDVPLSTVDAVRRTLAAPPNQGKYFTTKALVTIMQTNGLLRKDLRSPQNTVLEAAKRLVQREPEFFERVDEDGSALFRCRPLTAFAGLEEPTKEVERT